MGDFVSTVNSFIEWYTGNADHLITWWKAGVAYSSPVLLTLGSFILFNLNFYIVYRICMDSLDNNPIKWALGSAIVGVLVEQIAIHFLMNVAVFAFTVFVAIAPTCILAHLVNRNRLRHA